MNKTLFSLAGAVCLSTALSSNVLAAPSLSGEVVVEVQSQWGVDSDDKNEERNNTFLRTEIAPTLSLTKNLSIDGVLVVEPVKDLEPGEDGFFDDEGAFFEELKLNYDQDSWGVFAGKFNPGFGIAWDYGRGIWGEDFAEDYEITEKVGFGGYYAIDGGMSGTHTVTASTFFSDTSFLADSAVTGRGNVTKSDGGAANTEDFSSYVVALEGENILGTPNLYYKLGYRHLAEGDANTGGDDETGYEATVGHVFDLSKRVQADALVEYVDIEHFDGAASDDRRYVTASLITTLDKSWNVTVSYTDRTQEVTGSPDVDDYLLQISGGYDFGNGLTLEAGWRDTEENQIDTDMIGALARYSFEF